MNATDYFSANSYLFLPTANNPRVALAVDNAEMAKNAFKLYNPFSSKAQMLKKVSATAFTHFNEVAKHVWNVQQKEKSGFVTYLEEKLKTPLVASLYFATIHDKIVLQLQTPQAQIVGYVKYPLNEVGLQHLKNEKRAIEILSKKQIVSEYFLYDEFEGTPFLLLEALDGDIGEVERSIVDDILSKFKREATFKLLEHPRVNGIKKSLECNGLSKYLSLVEKVCKDSTAEYGLVYEHGDFTPWNIVKVEDKYTSFDFEHFVEEGIEYFDLIKYYYQTGKLLEKKSGEELLNYISEQVEAKEIKALLTLFVIKEIIRNKEENEPYDFEEKMLSSFRT